MTTEERSQAIEEARHSLEMWVGDVKERVARHPFRALAIALGAGYVAGGGLFTSLTGRLVMGAARIGLRVAALPVVRDEIYALVDALSPQRRQSAETERRTQ